VEVIGVSGSIVKKFREFEEVVNFIALFKQTSQPQAVAMAPSPASDSHPRESQYLDMTIQIQSQGASKCQPREGDLGYRPPMVLAGPDPSVKKDEEAFLLDLRSSETELRKKLSPVGLPDGESKGLANGMADIVVLQGGSQDGGSSRDESNNNGLVFIGEALEEMVNQNRMDFEGVRKMDLRHWRSVKRTALRGVTTNSEQLRKQIKLSIRLREKVVKYTIKSSRNACMCAGWTDQARTKAWAHVGYYTCIIHNTMNYYLSLRQHLLGLATSNASWEYTQVEIDHHVEEMEVI
jgi:hypothetical protein